MKRIFSKKSGFTLVEIVVAFAVFAIMATMILSMVQLTVQQRDVNNQLAENISDDNLYLAEHYVGESDKYDTTEGSDGTFRLDFSGNDVDAELDYQLRGNPAYTNEAGGINYFVGKTDYKSIAETPEDDEGDIGIGQAQSTRYTTWITGTRNLNMVRIMQCQRDTSYTGSGVRYLFKTSCDASTVENDYQRYAQYRLTFKLPTFTQFTQTKADGSEVTYKIYDNAKITDYGYIDTFGNLVAHTDYSPSLSAAHNKYLVEQTSANTIHITTAMGDDSAVLDSAVYSTFWVVFASDPFAGVPMTTDLRTLFGDNAQNNGGGIEYYQFAGDYTANIYGAYELETIESD